MPDVFEVNPWDVRGVVDYERLVRDFGTQVISDGLYEQLATHGGLPVSLRRKFWFSHRDLDLVLKDYAAGKGFYVYTGRAPSGPMHIGHLFSFLLAKWFQDVFKVNVYVQIPDDEKFCAKAGMTLEEVDRWTADNLLDIAAVGFDPNKTFVFQDREFIKQMYTPALRIAKKLHWNLAKAVFGFGEGTNVGHMFYPALQMVPCFFERRRCLIPAAIDQDPYWRVVRDFSEGFGYSKPAQIHSKFVVPLTGMAGKMSSSVAHHAILLSDDAAKVKEKIVKHAFSGGRATLEEHRRLGGNPDVDVSYQWLATFLEEDDKKVEYLYNEYAGGRLLSGDLKKILVEKLIVFLSDHQRKRKSAEDMLKKLKYTGKLAKQMWEFKDIT